MDFWLSFATGIFGSMHCVGMCGPIVLWYSTQGISTAASPLSALLNHLSYNAGRVVSISIVGGVLGLVGGGITALQGTGHWFSLSVGVLLFLAGVSLLRILPRFRFSSDAVFSSEASNIFARFYRKAVGYLFSSRTIESKFYIGFLTPLLPCGLLYVMFLKAASSGDLLSGALTMAAFGLGIVSALVITGFASSFFGQRLRSIGDKLAAVTVIIMGAALILRAIGIGVPFLSTHTGAH